MLKKSHRIYLHIYDSCKRPNSLFYGLDTGVTSHSLHFKGNETQAVFVHLECFAWKKEKENIAIRTNI